MTRVELSEQQWTAIQRASGLPEGARERIQFLLALYKGLQVLARQPGAGKTRRELLTIARRAEKLLTPFIGVNADARAVLRGGPDQDPFAVESILSRAQSHVLAALMPPVPDPAAGTAVRLGLGTPRRDALKVLCEQLSAVERLRHWFENAARSLPEETSTGAQRLLKITDGLPANLIDAG